MIESQAHDPPRHHHQDRWHGITGGPLCAVSAAAFFFAALLLGSFVVGPAFAADFDGGSQVGATTNPAQPALVLAIIGSLSAVGAFLCGPGRVSATAAALLFLAGPPIWLTTLELCHYYR